MRVSALPPVPNLPSDVVANQTRGPDVCCSQGTQGNGRDEDRDSSMLFVHIERPSEHLTGPGPHL